MKNLKSGLEFIFSSYKRTAAIFFIGAFTLAVPIIITLVGQQQDTKQGSSETNISSNNADQESVTAASDPTPIPHPEPPTVTPLPGKTISGTVFIDSIENGRRDQGETDYSGEADVILSGSYVRPATKYGTGYFFLNVIPGNWVVKLTTVPAGYRATTPTSYNITIFPPPYVSNLTFAFGIKSTGTGGPPPTSTRAPLPTTPPLSVTPASNLRTTFTCASATSVRPSFSWTPATITGGTFDAQYLDYALNQGLSYGLVGRNVWGLNQYQEGGFAQGITYWWRINARITGTNDWRSSSVVSFTTPNCRPDLFATLNQPPNLTVGQSTNFSGSIGNQLGGATSPSYARFCAALSNLVPNYQDCLNSATYMVGNAHYVGSLVAAGTRTSLTSASQTPSAAGTYKAWLCADASLPSGLVDEQIETNNCQSKTFTVSPLTPTSTLTSTPTRTPTPTGTPPADYIPPTSVIKSPAEGSTQTSTFTVTVADSVNTGGAGLYKCYYAVFDQAGAGPGIPRTERTCNAPIVIKVGPTSYGCQKEGPYCNVRIDAVDKAGKVGSPVGRNFTINLSTAPTATPTGTSPDTIPPESLIKLPATGSTQTSPGFTVTVTDSDTGGSGLYKCYYAVFDQAGAGPGIPQTERVCNAPIEIKVGPTAYGCQKTGPYCNVRIHAVDNAGKIGSPVGRNFTITFTGGGGQASIFTTDNKTVYKVGDPIRYCYTIPGRGQIKITKNLSGVLLLVLQQRYNDGTGGCFDARITRPLGNQCLKLEYATTTNPGERGTKEACFPVIAADPTSTPQPGATATPIPTATPVPTGTTNSAVAAGMAGIGASQNPASGINNNPRRSQRDMEVMFINSSNQDISTFSTTVNFDSATGQYSGNVGLGDNFVSGSYLVKVRLDNTLWKLVPGIQNITSGQIYSAQATSLVSGDIIQDNEINLLDYNALLSCYASEGCETKTQADSNDDGKLDELDFNILYSGIAKRIGD